MVTPPAPTAETATKHAPEERAQVAPPGNDTNPVLGLTGEKVIKVPSIGTPPEIEALQFVDEPTITVDGAQDAKTDGDALLTVMVVGGADVLGLLLPSPPYAAIIVVTAVVDGV